MFRDRIREREREKKKKRKRRRRREEVATTTTRTFILLLNQAFIITTSHSTPPHTQTRILRDNNLRRCGLGMS